MSEQVTREELKQFSVQEILIGNNLSLPCLSGSPVFAFTNVPGVL